MTQKTNSILLIGESGVGKTHYGAQLLKRLMRGDGTIRMRGAASNLEPFETAMSCLDEGISADHTPVTTYVESIWPICDSSMRDAELVWPDYGGEQIRLLTETRRIPFNWHARVENSNSWIFLIRLQQIRNSTDILSKPIAAVNKVSATSQDFNISDQARLVELLQILLYLRQIGYANQREMPKLCVLLSCWDELEHETTSDVEPATLLKLHLPMLHDYIYSKWVSPIVLGLSALGKSLSSSQKDLEYSNYGPDNFGFVVLENGVRDDDLTLPIQFVLGRAT